MNYIEMARKMRPLIVEAMQELEDETAVTVPYFFNKWEPDMQAFVGDRLRYGEKLYRVLQQHTTQEGWEPDIAPSLFAEVLIPDPEVIPEWAQPDSTNPYMKGDRVTHNGKTWESLVDNNVWEPGAVGTESLWAEVVNGEAVLVEPVAEPNPDPEPEATVAEWVQPDSTNPYMTGDTVTYNGATWVSTVDNNVWAPGVYGWSEA